MSVSLPRFGRLRDEGLNTNWFLSLAAPRSTIETWRPYNGCRPHAALGGRTPLEFTSAAARQAAA